MTKTESAYMGLLYRTLQALNWRGTEYRIREALPADGTIRNLQEFRNTLAHLGYATTFNRSSGLRMENQIMPIIRINARNKPVLIRDYPDALQARKQKGRYLTFQPSILPMTKEKGMSSLWQELRRFHPLFMHILFLSLLIGALSLAPIFYNRTLYDHVIASSTTYGLHTLMAGVSLALAGEMTLRVMRNKRLSVFGARLDHFFSCSMFERLLFLPPLYTERAAQSAQLARLRDFDNVREFFTGPLSALFFELPLIGLYMLAMVYTSGWITLVPVALVGAYLLLLKMVLPRLKEHARATADAASQRQDFILETLAKLRAIRQNGMDAIWQQRYETLSARSATSSFRLAYSAQVIETSSYVLMTIGGLVTLGLGVVHVLNDQMTAGALMATMMLVWRIIAPLQVCCASVSRFEQMNASVQQARRLLALPPESNPYAMTQTKPVLSGQISFHRVSLRYGSEAEPALLGVSLTIQPGQIVAIRGANGSGKSTLLKLVLGFYQPQNGSIRLDGVDLRQFDPRLLRQTIAYVPQTIDLFPGTLRDNLLFAAPDATDEMCLQALREANALEDVDALSQGLDSIIAGPDGESTSFLFKQRFNLARAYLKAAPILLLDEAMQTLGEDNDAFIRKLESLRGNTTVILVTHREDHMMLADQLLVMNKGELTHAGPSQQVLKALRG